MNLPSTNNEPKTKLGRFFFAKEVPFGVALVRMLLPLAAGTPMFMRFTRVRELYSSDGSPVQMFELFGHGSVLPVLPPNLCVPLYSLMLLCIVTAVVGFRTRLSLCIATVLYIYFNFLDGVGTMTKYSVIASHLFLLLSISNCGAVWSVDAFLKKRSGNADATLPTFPVWPARLMQLMFAHLYFGAAITKIQTDSFFSGEQMRYWMLSNWNYENPFGEVMAMWAPMLLVSAYMAVVWEMMFPFLVWRPMARLFVLGLGVTFHFMTWLTLGLYIFPAICISGYFAFASERDVVIVRNFFRRIGIAKFVALPLTLCRRGLVSMPQLAPAAVVWTCLAAVCAIAGTESELRLDLYGANTPEGGYRLKPMDSTVARTMIEKQQRIREHDKFFNFEIGTQTIGDLLANRRSQFTYGDLMLVQANLNPPHEDMWIECLLKDEEGRTIEQFGQFVTREMLRANFSYKIGNKLIPGNYHMVLKSANQEIYEGKFTLSGTPNEGKPGGSVLTN